MLILIQLPGKLTYNKIGLTKVLKYNFADIVTGILPKNHFYGSYLGFCVLSNFFGTIRQTPIWQTRQSDKHKRKSGRQYTCLSDCHCCYLQFVGLSLVFVGFSFINVCRIVQFAGFFCMKIRQIDRNYTCHPSNTFNFSWMLS